MLKLLRSDYEQGDLLYFTLAQKTASKTKHLNRERIWKNEGEWTGKFKTGTRKKFLAVGEACLAIYSDLLQALKAEHLSALGSQQREHSFLRLQCPTVGGVLSKPFSLL